MKSRLRLNPRRRFALGVVLVALAVGISIDRADYLLASDRWIAVVVAVAALMLAERAFRLPSGSVVLGYCVIGLSPDLVLGWVQIAPAEILTAVLLLLLLFGIRKLSVGRETLRALRLPAIGWAAFGVALSAGALVAALSGPPLTTSGIGELLRWGFAPGVALVVLIARTGWSTGVTVGLLTAGTAHAALICYQAAAFATLYQNRPYGLMSSGSSLAGEIIANPNAAGVAAAMVSIFAVGICAELASQGTRRQIHVAVLVAGIAALCAAGAIVTLSRSAWLFLVVGCVVVAIRTRSKWAVALLVAGAVLVMVLPATQGRLLRTLTDSSAPEFSGPARVDGETGRSIERVAIVDRVKAWALALEEGADRGPVVGLGPQALERIAGTPADNSYLEAFVDAGAIGAVGLLLLACSAPFAIARLKGPAWSVGGAAAFSVIGALGNYWFDPRLLFLWMMFLALGIGRRGQRLAETEPPVRARVA